MIDVPCPRDGYGVYETYGWNERHFTWGIDTLDGKMTVKLPKPYLGFISTEPYLEHDLLYNPNEEASALVSSYVTRHTNNPYRGVVISEHQEWPHFCENLDQYGRQALILRTRVDRHTGQRDPMCQKNTECDSLSESDCKAKSSSCTRKTGSSSNSKLQCVRQDGKPATDADCASIGDKPSCSPGTPTPTPTACTPGEQRDCTPDSKGDPCQLKQTCGSDKQWGECKPDSGSAKYDMHCNKEGQSVWCGHGGSLILGTTDDCACSSIYQVNRFKGIIPRQSPWDKNISYEIAARENWTEPCGGNAP